MGKNISKVTTTFQFCDGGSCRKAKSEMAVREARAHLRNEGLWNDTHSIRTRCNGRCEDAPTWIVQPGNYWYKNLTPEKAVEIVDAHTKHNQPVDEYLLYQEGWDALATENEKTVAPVVFKEKNDAEFGEVLVARSSASDQYIYPLFKKLFEAPTNLRVSFPDGTISTIANPHTVTYTDTFDMIVEGTDIILAIGPIPRAIEAEVDQVIKDRKVSVAEVIWDRNHLEDAACIRLKNKKGKHLLSLHISKKDTAHWEYVLRIYLQMDINNPKIVAAIEN
ncbi:(2Fe-2S) ferredoxin domain-containing protein [Kordia sp.]|uniref:(2Fe-2S) ferredoxin domain-containing protein n=1 Tax=Kordia sp. TaxID=1965332 RepID=UPI0025C4E848|nr:(2Fe-2S) ferredoxin domain-containing protein [Kordia sp.]MCH2194819.1 (2Fe-2S) ferredoxin domain-containing protein [Kordia sp.]